MTRARLLLAVATSFAAAAGTSVAVAQDGGHDAAPEPVRVSVGYADYTPRRALALVGEPVVWTNESVRRHTVTADDLSFDSGSMSVGDTYARTFTTEGSVPYHCRLHAGIAGQVEVRSVLLDAPATPGAPRKPYPLEGRAASAPGSAVAIEAASPDGGWTTAATTTVEPGGHFRASVTPSTTTRYRAVTGEHRSPEVDLIVLDRTVTAAAVRARRGPDVLVTAKVAPAAPGQTAVVQAKLPERFGWWPLRTLALDARSRLKVRIPIRRSVPLRVVLTLPDGATPLATSKVVRIPRLGRSGHRGRDRGRADHRGRDRGHNGHRGR